MISTSSPTAATVVSDPTAALLMDITALLPSPTDCAAERGLTITHMTAAAQVEFIEMFDQFTAQSHNVQQAIDTVQAANTAEALQANAATEPFATVTEQQEAIDAQVPLVLAEEQGMDGADIGSGMQEAPFDLDAQARRQSLAQLAQRVIEAYRVEHGLAGTFLLPTIPWKVTDLAAGPAIAPEPNKTYHNAPYRIIPARERCTNGQKGHRITGTFCVLSIKAGGDEAQPISGEVVQCGCLDPAIKSLKHTGWICDCHHGRWNDLGCLKFRDKAKSWNFFHDEQAAEIQQQNEQNPWPGCLVSGCSGVDVQKVEEEDRSDDRKEVEEEDGNEQTPIRLCMLCQVARKNHEQSRCLFKREILALKPHLHQHNVRRNLFKAAIEAVWQSKDLTAHLCGGRFCPLRGPQRSIPEDKEEGKAHQQALIMNCLSLELQFHWVLDLASNTYITPTNLTTELK
ncbi:hypothetical protein B0H13DRAFT_1869904 [Mycena leptocephala]|nr:hypothetical protein B0H13DRAFT_1869904 [Mycena leptocephala]